MTVSFNQIPGNLRVPFVRIEVNSGQSPYQSISRNLIFGQMFADIGPNNQAKGTATPNVPILVTGSEDALFGIGSQAATMYKDARKAAPFQEIWVVPLSDALNATKAGLDITISGAVPVAEAGTIVLYIDGFRIAVPVDTSMTQTQIANAINTAINTCNPMTAYSVIKTAGVKASGTATISGTASAGGYASVTIDGTTFSAEVTSGQAATAVATNLAAAINAAGGNVTASVNSAVVTYTWVSTGLAPNNYTTSGASTATGITVTATALSGGTNTVIRLNANNAGTLGNGIGVYTRLNSDDGAFTDHLLSGVNTSMSGGAGDPSITTAITNLGEDLWDFITMPYAQSAYCNALDAWLTARWGPMSQTYGTYYTAKVGATAGEVMAFSATRNGQYGSMMPMHNSPQAAYRIAAVYGALAAAHLQDAPELSRPLQTLVMTGILPPKLVGDRWSTVERQSFYYAGASAFIVDHGGNVMIDRAVTFYQQDAWGNPDQSWLDVNTLAQLMYGLRYIKQYISETYPRCALVNENPAGLQNFVTPRDIFTAMVHAYTGLVDLGVFQDVDRFQSMLIVEKNSQDPNRVDTYLPVEAVNQLRVLAINATSFVQYPTAN